ncbi:MAG: Uma2 family endonuclease [Xenococcaceae cyanobacterium]
MTQATTKPFTFQEFLEQLPGEGRYELVNGEIVRIQPTIGHDNVVNFLYKCIDREIDRLELNYVVRQNVLIRTETQTGQEQGRNPDLCVIDKTVWNSDISAYSALTEPFPMVVEVVSTNWRDDYIDKLDEYQRLGIREYWIVDDLMMVSANYLSNPKAPTVLVYRLVKDQYEVTRFQGDERIISLTFPELELTVAQIAAARLG